MGTVVEEMKGAVMTFRVIDLKESLKLLRISTKGNLKKVMLQEKLIAYIEEKFSNNDVPPQIFCQIMKLKRCPTGRGKRWSAIVYNSLRTSPSIQGVCENWESTFYDTVEMLYEPQKITSKTMLGIVIPNELTPLFKKKNRVNDVFSYEVQVRFDKQKGAETARFSVLRIIANDKIAMEIPNAAPIQYITRLFPYKRTISSNFTVEFPFYDEEVCTSVALVKRLSPENLLKFRPLTEVSKTKELVIKELKAKCSSVYEVSLLCPFTKKKITKPCRSSFCSHAEVFDVVHFLEEAQGLPHDAWKCPICSNPVTYESLELEKSFQVFDDKKILNFIFHKKRKPEEFIERRDPDFCSATQIITID